MPSTLATSFPPLPLLWHVQDAQSSCDTERSALSASRASLEADQLRLLDAAGALAHREEGVGSGEVRVMDL